MKQQPIEGSLFHYDDTPQATPRKKPGRKPLVCEPEPRASLTKNERKTHRSQEDSKCYRHTIHPPACHSEDDYWYQRKLGKGIYHQPRRLV